MPGTTRYSATFDRTYEEEPKPSSPPNSRRSRSQSWQANSGHDGRQYTPFASRSPAPRSSSTDNNPSKGTEFIPTRTAKTSVKAHNNPFQFVKVGTCPLYKKAEEQLKKVKEIKKPDVLKEEEEEWQSNLDSWKSRRRKMSEDVIRRQEEIKLFELEEQIAQASQKKTKTFSEMVESRATRGRALSLCLLTSPLEFQNWEFENKTHKNGSCSYTDESGENSTVNSEDEGVSVRGRHGENSNENEMNHRTNGDAHIEQSNGSKLDTQNGNCNKLPNTVQLKPKENSYIDSGLESISSSHRAGDTPDSGSDFSQDSNSSIDCDSPRTGVNVLEEFGSKASQISEGHDIAINLNLDEKGQDFGFTFIGGKNEGQVIIASILEGSKAESSDMHLGDRIITIDGCEVNSKKHIEIAALIQKGREKGQINLLLWRHAKASESTNGLPDKKHTAEIVDGNLNAKSYEKSIESENEMYVDDFEDLKRQSELLANKKFDVASTNAQAETNGYKTPNKDAMSLKISTESSTAPILNTITPNCAVEEQDKNEEKTEINNGNQKKNIIKVKRVRRKGVYALNVDPNQISQEGTTTNSLFPLSPVTELPSPADENKTVSRTLLSYLPASISQNGISNEGKQNDVESKPSITTSEGNITIAFTSLKTENSKSADLHNDLKNTENKTRPSVAANKAETKNTLSLTSKNDDLQDEKSKTFTGSKKNKSDKLKKESNSILSEHNLIMPSTEVAIAPIKIQESISPPSDNAKSQSSKVVTNGVEISTASKQAKNLTSEDNKRKKNTQKKVIIKSKENNSISSEHNSITPATEVAVVPIKIQDASPSDDTKYLSSKVVANGIEISTANKQAKNLIIEDNKSKKIAQNTNLKSKESYSISSENNSITPATEIVIAPIKIQESISSPSDDTKNEPSKVVAKGVEVSAANKQPKNLTSEDNKPKKNIQKKILKSKESNSISSEHNSITPAIEVAVAPIKIQETISPPSNDTKSQTSKVVTNGVANNQADNLTSEDIKPKKNIQKKVIIKSKESNGISPEHNSITPATEVAVASIKVEETISSLSDHIKSQPLKVVANGIEVSTANKQAKNLTSEDNKPKKNSQKNVILKSKESNNKSSEQDSITSATEVAIAPVKIQESISPVTDDTKSQLSKVVANGTEVSTTNKQTKNLISDDNKPKKHTQKKVIIKSKGNITENKSHSMSADVTLNEIYSTKKQNVSSVMEKQEKVCSKNETTEPSLKEEKNTALNGVTNCSQEIKSSPEKDDISILGPSTNKVRDLALKFGVKNSSVSSEVPVTPKNEKQLKSPSNGKQKLVISAKKENAKTKENSVQKSPPVTPQTVTEASVASSALTKINIGQENKTEKKISAVNIEKQPEISAKTQTVTASSKGANIGEQVPVDNKQDAKKSVVPSSSNAPDSTNSGNLNKEIQLKKEKKTTFTSQDEQEKCTAKNETKVSPLARVINFYKSHK